MLMYCGDYIFSRHTTAIYISCFVLTAITYVIRDTKSGNYENTNNKLYNKNITHQAAALTYMFRSLLKIVRFVLLQERQLSS